MEYVTRLYRVQLGIYHNYVINTIFHSQSINILQFFKIETLYFKDIVSQSLITSSISIEPDIERK